MYMVGVQQEETGDTAAPPPVVVVKGKRSKRQRVHATAVVITPAATAESSSSVAAPDDDGWRSGADEAVSGCVTEEEEDMALCLMLLARGGGRASHGAGSSMTAVAPDAADSTAAVATKEAKFRSRRPADGAAGEFVYECKTCSKCFPSFQALGGHRTSHKKPRLTPPLPPTTPTASDEKKRPATTDEKPPLTSPPSPPPAAAQSSTTDPTVLAIPATPKQEADTSRSGSSKQPRVHECSMCGAEFASGQALGGHMRRHRPLVPALSSSALDDGGPISRKEKSLLELDLNMPAPCDDATATTAETPPFAFAVKELFPASAASALVDCHY